MSDDWDFYLCRVDDRMASMFVDLGIARAVPVPELPYMACVRLRMGTPREDGMSSNEEYEALIEVEDTLTARLVDDATVYVGRCTTNGCRDFFFYVDRPDRWDDRVAEAMGLFPGYAYEAYANEDADWSTYLSYLCPNPAQRQSIENRRVCDVLQNNGDRMIEAREIDHWAHFADPASRDAYVAEATQLGYAVRTLDESGEDANRFGARLWRTDIPGFDRIDDVTMPLFELAERLGGEYDGWETMVLR